MVERMLDGYPRTAHKAYRGRLSTTIPGGNVWRSVADMRIDSLGDPPMNRVLTAMTVFATLCAGARAPRLQAQGSGKSSSSLVSMYPLLEQPDYCADFGKDRRGDIVWQHPQSHALLVQSIYRGALLPATSMAATLEHDLSHDEHVMAINCMDHDVWSRIQSSKTSPRATFTSFACRTTKRFRRSRDEHVVQHRRRPRLRWR